VNPFVTKHILNIKNLFSFILAFFIIFFLFSQADVKRVFAAILSAHLGYYVAALLLFVITFIVLSVRWQILLRGIGLKLRIMDVVELLLLLQFVNNIVPAKLGNVYASYLIKKNYKQPLFRALGTLVVDRFADILMLVIFLTLAIFYGNFGVSTGYYMNLLKVVYFILAAFIVLFIILHQKIHSLFSFFPKWLEDIIHNLATSITTCLHKKNILLFTASILIFWVLHFFRFYIVFLALGVSLPFATLSFIILVAVVSQLFPLTPSGLGVVEAGTVGALVLVGIDPATALAFTLLERFISYWLVLFIGFFVFVLSKKT